MSSLPSDRLAFRPGELPGLLGIGRDAAYELARKLGKRVGNKILVPRSALENWLNASDDKVHS